MKKDIIFPMVHLNGTGETTLRREYYDFYKALCKAQSAMKELTFHARDYYPLGENAFSDAIDERREMMDSLVEFRKYIQMHVYELNKGKGTLPEEEE